MLVVRRLYLTTGFLVSGHMLYLGYRVPTLISVTLVRPPAVEPTRRKRTVCVTA